MNIFSKCLLRFTKWQIRARGILKKFRPHIDTIFRRHSHNAASYYPQYYSRVSRLGRKTSISIPVTEKFRPGYLDRNTGENTVGEILNWAISWTFSECHKECRTISVLIESVAQFFRENDTSLGYIVNMFCPRKTIPWVIKIFHRGRE